MPETSQFLDDNPGMPDYEVVRYLRLVATLANDKKADPIDQFKTFTVWPKQCSI